MRINKWHFQAFDESLKISIEKLVLGQLAGHEHSFFSSERCQMHNKIFNSHNTCTY